MAKRKTTRRMRTRDVHSVTTTWREASQKHQLERVVMIAANGMEFKVVEAEKDTPTSTVTKLLIRPFYETDVPLIACSVEITQEGKLKFVEGETGLEGILIRSFRIGLTQGHWAFDR